MDNFKYATFQTTIKTLFKLLFELSLALYISQNKERFEIQGIKKPAYE